MLFKLLTSGLCLTFCAACAAQPTARAPTGNALRHAPSQTTAVSAGAALHALFDQAWKQAHAQKKAGKTADYKTLWSDPSRAHEQTQTAQARANLAALEKIDFARLDPT